MKTDHQLKQDVTTELIFEPSVVEAHIGVSAKDGIVTLSGHVPSLGEKYGAEKAAKRISGVRAVANELEVHLPSSARRSDSDIAAACVAALRASTTVPDTKLKVLVSDGWVTLEGKLEWQYQKAAAEHALKYLVGIRGVSNSIEVKPIATSGDVKAKIEAAFKRSAEIDADRIEVETKDGKVTLRGKVHTWLESNEALNAAWSAPGVTVVENHLVIAP
jgi:osmotically-inducible protein OsmY